MITNSILVVLIILCITSLSNGQECCNKSIIRVQGLGQNRIRPNIAILYASLTAEATTAQKAFDQVNKKVETIIYKLEGDNVNSTDIQASSVKIYPKYVFTNNTNNVNGYIAYLQLTVTIKRIQDNTLKIGKIIDSMASQGVSSISGLSYDVQDPNSGKETAISDAFEDANQKAILLTQLAQRQLGNITLIQQSTYQYTPYFYTSNQIDRLTRYTSTDFENESIQKDQTDTISYDNRDYIPQIPVGTVLVRATVIVTWEFEPLA